MAPEGDQGAMTPEISPVIVRDIAQSRPQAGDFRERFAEAQPEVIEFVFDHLESAAEFTCRLAAAIWAMYEEAIDEGELPALERDRLETFAPIARRLLESLLAKQEDAGAEDFDPEWLLTLPRGAQPHLQGFLIGALRTARFSLPPAEILEAAALLFAISGALEGAASTILHPKEAEES